MAQGKSRRLRSMMTAIGLSIAAGVFTHARGQVIHDGSLGAGGTVPGPNYSINAARGMLVGSNLFHSFSRFDVGAGEVATFQSPGSVRSILARVTGGSRSEISGTLVSDTPGANLFLINPGGVLFGPGARLQVKGSFTVSTADVVKLADGGRFNCNLPTTDDLLTTADPSAFGFASGSPARVTLTGLAGQRALLNVSTGQSLSIISGKVRMEQARLKAPSGQVNLVALESTGEVAVNPIAVKALQQAPIELDRGAEINVDGAPGGRVVLRGGKIVLAKTKAKILAQNYGVEAGAGIDIRAIHDFISLGQSSIAATTHGDGAGGDIVIRSQRVLLDGLGASDNVFGVVGGTDAAGRGADVSVRADSVIIRDSTKISTESLGGGGQAGSIGIRAREIRFDAAQDPNLGFTLTGLSTRTKATAEQDKTGRAGNIVLDADVVSVLNTARISADSQGAGPAGTIHIRTQNLTLDGQRGASFSSITATTGRRTNSAAGQIDLRAADTIHVGNGALVRIASTGTSSPGKISLTGGQLRIHDGARVESGTEGTRNGSALAITVRKLTIESGGVIKASANDVGNGGRVAITAIDAIEIDGALANENSVTGIRAETASAMALAGAGGSVTAETRSLSIRNRGEISVASKGPGAAGNIHLTIDGPLRMSDRKSTAPEVNGLVTGIFAGSEAADVGGKGGTISIIARDVLMSGPTAISANTNGRGTGGDVLISAANMRLSGGAQIAAASRSNTVGGPPGDVRISLRGELHADNSLITVSSRTLRVQAGDLVIRTVGDIELRSSILSARSRGLGGNITLTVPDSANVTLQDATIVARASKSGEAAKITIDPNVVSLRGASLIDGKAGGVDVQVSIFARGIVKSIDSQILTDRGIFSIDDQLAASLVPLTLGVNSVGARLQPLCTPKPMGELSSFLSLGRGGVALDPERAAPSNSSIKQEPERR
ncbi:hypothetical protein BH09PLA1_BH09PLA1_05750 [soil metagenome]